MADRLKLKELFKPSKHVGTGVVAFKHESYSKSVYVTPRQGTFYSPSETVAKQLGEALKEGLSYQPVKEIDASDSKPEQLSDREYVRALAMQILRDMRHVGREYFENRILRSCYRQAFYRHRPLTTKQCRLVIEVRDRIEKAKRIARQLEEKFCE